MTPPAKELELFFRNTGHHHIAALVAYLQTEEGSGYQQIGSGTYDVLALPGEDMNRLRNWHRLTDLRIGSMQGGTPLQALEKVMQQFDKIPGEGLFILNEACAEFLADLQNLARLRQGPEEGSVKCIEAGCERLVAPWEMEKSGGRCVLCFADKGPLHR